MSTKNTSVFPLHRLPEDMQLLVAGFAGHSILPVSKDFYRKGIKAIFYFAGLYASQEGSSLGALVRRHLNPWKPEDSTQANAQRLNEFFQKILCTGQKIS